MLERIARRARRWWVRIVRASVSQSVWWDGYHAGWIDAVAAERDRRERCEPR